MEDHVILCIVALIIGGLVECTAIFCGEDGALLGPFLIFCGAVAGIPVGQAFEKKRMKAPG